MAPLPRPRKRFGQHFLESAWVARLLEAQSPAPADVFLEIGPGRGALTFPLAAKVRRVVAVEIDRDLAAHLRSELPPNVRVVEGDFLDLDLQEVLRGEPRPVRVVGNLPYNVSVPVVLSFLESFPTLERVLVMVQLEVGERLAAGPVTKAYGIPSVRRAWWADATVVGKVARTVFVPQPRVDSALVDLRRH